jgi:MatE
MSEENQSFIGYEPTVKDPGHALTAWTVVVCILVNCSLPLLVRLASLWDQHKTSNQASNETTNAKGNTPQDAGSLAGKPSSSTADSSSPAVNMSLTRQTIFQLVNNASPHGHGRSVSSPSFTSDDGVRSVCSIRTNASSSLVSIVASSVLSGGRPRVRKNRCRTARGGSHLVRSHVAQPPAHAEDDIHTSDNEVDVSVLEDESVSPDSTIHAFQIVIEEEDVTISLWNQFLDIVDWDDESKRLLALTIPYTIQGCTQGLFQMVNVAIIGNYVGVMQANAFVVVAILLEFSGTLTYGFGEAIGTLVPQAGGAGNLVLAGRYLQLSQILYSVMTIPTIIIWSIWTEDAVLWFGFDKETAMISQEYAYPFLVQLFLKGFNHGIHEFLSAMGHERYSTVAQIVYYGVECLGVVIAISSGVKSLQVIGIVQAFLGFVMSILNVLYILYRGWMDEYWEGLIETLSLRVSQRSFLLADSSMMTNCFFIVLFAGWACCPHHGDHCSSALYIMAFDLWRGKVASRESLFTEMKCSSLTFSPLDPQRSGKC